MVIAWNNVSLRDNREGNKHTNRLQCSLNSAGLFNFQVQLYASGDIYFVYKDVPIKISEISDINHPCKVGVSG